MKRLTKHIGVATTLLSLVAATTLLADDKGYKGQFSSSDFDFASDATRGGIMEVQASELAKTRGVNTQVKEFGDRMVTDHTKVSAELKALASKKGSTLPTDLTAKQQRTVEHLQKLSGNDFDKEYIDTMVSDHKDLLKDFQKAAKNANDSELKAFASKTAGAIEQHLEMAKQIQESLKNSPTASR